MSEFNKEEAIFNKSEIAKIAGTSRNTVDEVSKGKKIENEKLQATIEGLFGFNKTLKDMVSHKYFYEICETAISKSRKIEVRKFATILQRMHMHIVYSLDKNPEENKKDYLD